MAWAVNRTLSDSEVRQILIKSLVFETANSECKGMIRPLKARSTPIHERIRNTADTGSYGHAATLMK